MTDVRPDYEPEHEPENEEQDAVSQESPQRLVIGRITSPHGVRGELRMYIYSHFPDNILQLEKIYIGDASEPRAVSRSRLKDNLAIMRVEGITSREMVDELRDELVRIDLEDAAPLEEGEFYHFEIIGLTALTEEGEQVGTVTDIIETGANDVYVITDDEGAETLIPALEAVVPTIDPEAGTMIIRPLRYSGED
ncbi:MAG: 16S rRNA processing protein RimM [Sphaerobacteraceae bacterium]|nr:MAG: 16S rRNA processing protein RimM [Sphaerobacteraceae bacterium]